MDLDETKFKAKDVIQFGIYIITATVLFISLMSKVDNLTESVSELKIDRKEYSGESKSYNSLIQNELKTLSIRAELNRQNIEIIKSDIEMLKMQYQNLNHK